MKYTSIAKRYVTALTNALPKEETLKGIDDAIIIGNALLKSNDVMSLLQNPTISRQKKCTIITQACQTHKASPHIDRFFNLLIIKDRLSALKDIVFILHHTSLTLQNKVEAKIYVPEDTDSGTESIILNHIKQQSTKKILPTFIKEKSLSGGFKAIIEGQLIDGSVTNTLNKLKTIIKS